MQLQCEQPDFLLSWISPAATLHTMHESRRAMQELVETPSLASCPHKACGTGDRGRSDDVGVEMSAEATPSLTASAAEVNGLLDDSPGREADNHMGDNGGTGEDEAVESVGRYDGDVGECDGEPGLYAGESGRYDGDVGEYN